MIEKQMGQRIQNLRKKKGLTQQQLSEMIDISPNHLSAIERGAHGVKVNTLVRIMLCLDCSANEIFADVIRSEYLKEKNSLKEQINNLTSEELEFVYIIIEELDKKKRRKNNVKKEQK